MEKITWVWGSSHQKSQQYTQFHSNRLKTLWDNWRICFCFLALLWHWIKVMVPMMTPKLNTLDPQTSEYMRMLVLWRSHYNNTYFPCFNKPYSVVLSRCSTWIASSPHQILSWSYKKCGRKWSQYVLLCADLVIPRKGQHQWTWYVLVAVNGAYKHGKYENFIEQLGCVRWTAGRSTGRANTTHYADPYDTQAIKCSMYT